MVSTSFIEWMSQITKYIQLETYLVALMIVGGDISKMLDLKTCLDVILHLDDTF